MLALHARIAFNTLRCTSLQVSPVPLCGKRSYLWVAEHFGVRLEPASSGRLQFGDYLLHVAGCRRGHCVGIQVRCSGVSFYMGDIRITTRDFTVIDALVGRHVFQVLPTSCEYERQGA